MRVVSLVPSLTGLVAALGRAELLVGVTDWCTEGAPEAAVRVRGTKNPDVQAVLALRPDLVLANTEENRAEDLERLRAAGVEVVETFPKRVEDVPGMIRAVADRVGGDPVPLIDDLADARALAAQRRPRTPLAALTLVWRKPWRGLGPDTYADDLLATCGFANVLTGWDERYPALEPSLVLAPQVVLLPSEPYAFGAEDLGAVEALVGPVPTRFVDGQLLTWHGPRTAPALRAFVALAVGLSEEAGGSGAQRRGQ